MSNLSGTFPVTVADYRGLARRRLPRFLFDYIDGGANAEQTLAANEAAFQQVLIRQRVLRDVSRVDTRTTLLGEAAALPVALGPVGMVGYMARRGEVQALRAARTAGIPFTLSTLGTCPPEELRAAAGSPGWFQLYMLRDRGVVRAVLERAQTAGCETLVFTVDLATTGLRHRDQRNGMQDQGPRGRLAKALQIAARPCWIWDVGLRGGPHHFGTLQGLADAPSDLNGFRAWLDGQFDASVTWKDIEWLRGLWPGRLLLKGLLEPEDGRPALDLGADGLVVSNHGGRQLDGVASTLSKLPAMVEAMEGRLEVYLDGGVRNGIDVFRALALGARGVLLGRAWVWALAGGGEAGLAAFLGTLRKELEVAMALSGVNCVADIGREQLDGPPRWE